MNHRIALVDDSEDSAEMFTEFLRRFCDELEVNAFRNGSDFLKTFRPGMYRVVVLDIAMPGMNGFEVLQNIRSVEPAIPAIAFTAHAGKETVEKTLKDGFNAVVTKPVHDLEAFCQKIVDFVNR